MSCIMNDALNLLSRTSLLQFRVVCVGSKVVLRSCGNSVSCSCRLTVDHRGVPEGLKCLKRGLGRQHTSQPLSQHLHSKEKGMAGGESRC